MLTRHSCALIVAQNPAIKWIGRNLFRKAAPRLQMGGGRGAPGRLRKRVLAVRQDGKWIY